MTSTGTKFGGHCWEAAAARNVVDEIEDFLRELWRAICFTAADQKIGEGCLGLRMAVASPPAHKTTTGSVLGLRALATISLTSPPPVLSVVACKSLMTVLPKRAKVALFS